MSMNRPQVYSWFDSYEELLSRLGIQFMPRNIWNLDEVGVQNIHKAESVVAPVGHPSYNVTAVEKGETSTVVALMNAYGDIPAPMVIHRGKSVGKGWKDGAPFGTLVKASDSGWINKELFLEFGEHFISFLKNEGFDGGLPHVLLMDNHYAHIFNLQFLELMKRNSVHVFALPPHTTHWLEPLDRVPFGTLKRSWNEEMRLYTRHVSGVKLEKKYFFKVFSPVWLKSMTVDLAQAGFRASGLFPVNRRTIPDDVFAPSSVTDRDLPSSSAQVPTNETLPSIVEPHVVNQQLTYGGTATDAVLSLFPSSIAIADQLLESTGSSSDAVQLPSSILPMVGGELPKNLEKAQSIAITNQVSTNSDNVVDQSTSLETTDQPLLIAEVSTNEILPSIVEPHVVNQQLTYGGMATDAVLSLFPSSVAIADQLLESDAAQLPSSILSMVGGELPKNLEKTQSIVITNQVSTNSDNAADQSTSLVTTDQPLLSTVTFASLMPVPHRERSRGKPRKKPPSYEVTSDECMSYVTDRTKKTCARSKPKIGSGVRGQVKKAAKAISSNGESSASCGKAKKKCREEKSVKRKAAKQKKVDEDEATHSSTDNTACAYCEIIYCESDVPWIQCKVCRKWVCGQCAHLGKKSKKMFKCDGCYLAYCPTIKGQYRSVLVK